MSYGVHIERFGAQDSDGITLEEWLEYVRSDPEMHHLGEAVMKSSKGNIVRYDAPGMTEWIDPQTGHKTLFDHRKINGTVSVGNPSQKALRSSSGMNVLQKTGKKQGSLPFRVNECNDSMTMSAPVPE